MMDKHTTWINALTAQHTSQQLEPDRMSQSLTNSHKNHTHVQTKSAKTLQAGLGSLHLMQEVVKLRESQFWKERRKKTENSWTMKENSSYTFDYWFDYWFLYVICDMDDPLYLGN